MKPWTARGWRLLLSAALCLVLPACFKVTHNGGDPAGSNVQPKLTLKGHTEWIHSIAFSPDGKTLASGSQDRTIILWDVATGKATSTWTAPRPVESVAFSPDGKTLAAAAQTEVELWDVNTGTKTVLGNGNEPLVQLVAFSPDGKTVASAGASVPILVREVPGGNVVATMQPGEPFVQGLAFSPDGKLLAVGGQKQVMIWDVAKEKIATNLPTPAPVLSMTFSPDGKTLVGGSAPTVGGPYASLAIWDTTTWKRTAFTTGPLRFWAVAIGPDSKTVATGGEGSTVDLWDITTGKVTVSVKIPQLVRSVAISPNGKLLAAGLVDKTVLVWDLTAVK
jgi:WD40 repeat protein